MSAASDAFYVDFRKWRDAPHWHYQVFELGEDAHGRWFCLPGGSRTQRRPESETRTHPGTTAKLLPRHGAWVASFNAIEHPHFEIYVDVIAEPARVQGRIVRMVDIDLDVIRDRAGDVRIIDVDEFEEHRVSLRYPDALVAQARRTADEVRAAIAERREPFGSDGPRWLQLALARSWPIDPDWLAKLRA